MNPFIEQDEEKPVLQYYKQIDENIDKLEMNEDTYQIKYTGSFYNIKMELAILEKLDDKLNELKTAISIINSDARLEFWIHFYKVIDSQLNEIYKINENIKSRDEKELREFINKRDVKKEIVNLVII
ncbi:hypothetical protein KTC96_06470 [Clostridium estertheticum]|uniref:hypothetical protein n=1 Tax=Clostridium estertheticum TaxID=238834 RepID=UPI001C7DE9C1|nr:hypothetical protein [Clostridium estertheticum]MBX4262347.1 hypothetical protein [Clostridium estertheticum]WLC71642.1 hypothetical protein KTC96_06470 [Clostridium estertheticum]